MASTGNIFDKLNKTNNSLSARDDAREKAPKQKLKPAFHPEDEMQKLLENCLTPPGVEYEPKA